MLDVLLWVFLAIVALILLFGATPVLCEFRLSRDPDLRFRVLLSFFNGLLPNIPLSVRSPKRTDHQKRAHRDRKRRPTSRRKTDRRVSPGAVIDLFRQLLACVKVKNLSVDGSFGIGDPAETGHIFGLLTPVIYGVGLRPGVTFRVNPNFDHACLEGKVAGTVTVVPFSLLPPFARFGWRVFRP